MRTPAIIDFMEVTKYKIEFKRGTLYTANCSEFIGWCKYPQIHVRVIIAGKEAIFNFYKCPDQLFWFELLPMDENIAYSIAVVLGKEFNLQVRKRQGIQMEV